MRIKLRGRNHLFTFRNNEGQLASINLADFSGKIDFRRIVRSYLKEEGISVATRSTKTGAQLFVAYMKRPLTALDILRIALRAERR